MLHEDINECATNSDDCGPYAVCTNTFGNFTCTCRTGFSGDGRVNGIRCAGNCVRVLKSLFRLVYVLSSVRIKNHMQISMSVLPTLMTVTPMLSVPTLMVASLVHVRLATLEMVEHVQVCIVC